MFLFLFLSWNVHACLWNRFIFWATPRAYVYIGTTTDILFIFLYLEFPRGVD